MKNTILFLLSFLIWGSMQAQDAKFQAMAIYNFTRTLQWDDNADDANFVISVLDDGELYDELLAFTKDKKVNGKQKIIIKKAKNNKLDDCRILIIPKSKNSELSKIVENYKNSGTLIVTEQSNQTKKGACVSFTKKDGVIKYQYNIENIENQNIAASTSFKQIGIEK